MRKLLLALTFIAGNVLAEPPQDPLEEVPDSPPAPTGVTDEEELEAEVTIRKRGEDMVEEYRVNGRLFMVKIIPRIGFPYYLVDTNGDGNLDTRRDGLGPGVVPPNWILFRW
jgi:hypothetical protein